MNGELQQATYFQMSACTRLPRALQGVVRPPPGVHDRRVYSPPLWMTRRVAAMRPIAKLL